MKKCVIHQFGAVHEDVIPSVIYLLNLLDYKPEVYISKSLIDKKGNIFETINQLQYSIKVFTINKNFTKADLQKELRTKKDCDFIVANTYQKEEVVAWYVGIKKPIIAIVHNPLTFKRSKTAMQYATNKSVYHITLNTHISIYLRDILNHSTENIGNFIPFYLFNKINDPLGLLPNDDKINIAIPGSIDFGKRNVDNLIRELNKIKKVNKNNKLLFLVPGGGKHRKDFQAMIAKDGLESYFNFAPADPKTGFVDYVHYINYLNRSQFMISLLPEKSHQFTTFKIASVFFNSLCYNIPLLLDRRADIAYEMPSYLYSNDELGEFLLKLNSLTAFDYKKIKNDLYQFRLRNIEKGLMYFKRAIENFKIAN